MHNYCIHTITIFNKYILNACIETASSHSQDFKRFLDLFQPAHFQKTLNIFQQQVK